MIPSDNTVPLGSLGEDAARRQAIEEIITDEAMPISLRQARLEALAAEWGVPLDPEVADVANDPVRVQIAQALALLADGGHPEMS